MARCAIDDNGTGLYTTGLGHGDAMHLGDLDPDHPGLEVFDVHEPVSTTAGAEFRDADSGALIWGIASSGDVGRGCADDIYAGNPGAEMWASNTSGLRDRYGNYVGRAPSSTNFLVWWDADHARELLDDNHIDKYGTSSDTRLLTAISCSSNNSTKATPCLSADLFGDWREEVIWRTDDSQWLRIYTTTTPATDRIYTLMHDPQYRLSIAWQNVAYNQPPHTSFYLGDGMSTPPTPNIYLVQSGLVPPAAPTNVAAAVITPSRIDVTWTTSAGATSYRIKRSDNTGGPYYTIATGVTGASYSDTNVEVSGTYYYVVSAVSSSGESANSAEVMGSITGLPAPTGLTVTAVSSSQVDLAWTASAGATSYLVRRAYNSGGPYTTIASGVTNTSYSDTTVTSGPTYYYAVAAVSATNGSPNSSEVSATITLPAPWVAQDIGNVGITGHTIYSNGVFQVTGSNASSGDGFQFVNQGLIGNSTIIVKVDSQSADTGWGGIMIRKSSSSTSAYASVVATSDIKNHIFFYWRSSDGGSSSYSTGYVAVPIWFKLTRVGNVFTGYYSTDGTTWNLFPNGSTRTISMGVLTLGGLAVCSDAPDLLSTTQFSNVSITSANTAPTVATPASASPITSTTFNLSVLGTDDGGEGNLKYTWAATGTPPAPVSFSINGTHDAKNTVATFTKAGTYNLQVTIMDSGGLTVTSSVGVVVYSSIAGRMVFYNNSMFDWHMDYPNGDPAANVYDDNAIATNKQALLSGPTATSANYTSYSRGINGIIIDIQNPTNPLGLTAADFQFKVGNDNYPSGWSTGPAPSSVSVRQGQGAGGSDRVTITWDDIAGNSIKNQWLQVTVKANTNTGLSAADVFYFGNLIGESGSDAAVNTSDEQASRSNRTGFTLASVSNAYDYNRDRQVNASDDLIARHNSGASLWLLTGPLAAEDTMQPLALAAAPPPDTSAVAASSMEASAVMPLASLAAAPLVSSIATSIITPPAEVMPVALPFANSLLGDSGAMTASSSLPASDLLATKTMVFAYNLFEFNRLSQPLREISPPGKALADAGVQGAAAAFSSFEEIKRQAEQPRNAVFDRALFHDAVFGQTAAGKDLEGELNADKVNWLSDLEQGIIKNYLLKKNRPRQNAADAFLAGYQT